MTSSVSVTGPLNEVTTEGSNIVNDTWEYIPYPHELLYEHYPSKWEDPDSRISAIVLGIMELILMITEMIMMLLSDIHTFYQHKEKQQRKQNAKKAKNKIHPDVEALEKY